MLLCISNDIHSYGEMKILQRSYDNLAGFNNNSVKAVVVKQRRDKADSAMSVVVPPMPKEGWIRTIRKALDMSGAQLALRLGFTRNKVSILERREAEGEITINQLKEMANALNADLVYAVVPRDSIQKMITNRAKEIATSLIVMSNQNMFLEAQQISVEKQKEAIERTADEIKKIGGRALWKSIKDWSKR